MNPNSMTPVDWAKRPILEKYADFTGRAPRAEYWWYVLGLIIAFVVLSIIEGILGIKGMVFGVYGPLTCLLWLATIVPGIAVGVRRLHDTNRTGWWILAPLAPYILILLGGGLAVSSPDSPGAGGAIALIGMAGVAILGLMLLVFYFLEGTKGPNKYGADPKGGTNEEVFA